MKIDQPKREPHIIQNLTSYRGETNGLRVPISWVSQFQEITTNAGYRPRFATPVDGFS